LDGEPLGSLPLTGALTSHLRALGPGTCWLPLGAVWCRFRGVVGRTFRHLPRALANIGHSLYRNVERLGIPFDPQRRWAGHVAEQGG
jgi:hypothetical protein